MISAVLCSDYIFAQTIQKGLLQANLKTLIYKTDFSVRENYDFLYHDGFFILIRDPTLKNLDFCLNMRKLIGAKNLFILIETENLGIINKFRDNLDVPIFLSPFTYKYIAGIFFNKVNSLNNSYSVYNLNGISIKLDSSKRRLYMDDDRYVQLINKEFLLIEYFLSNKGKIVSRYDLLEYVWGKSLLGPTSTVDVHMSRLRRKLKCNLNFDPIKTVHCAGYMFG